MSKKPKPKRAHVTLHMDIRTAKHLYDAIVNHTTIWTTIDLAQTELSLADQIYAFEKTLDEQARRELKNERTAPPSSQLRYRRTL